MADNYNNATGGPLIKLFGFELTRANKKKEEKEKLASIVPPTDEDGAGYATASAGYFGQFLNMDGNESRDNHQLIMQYRGVAIQPEVDEAIDNIVNEAV